MSVFCLGVNHKTAPVEIRERLAISADSLGDHLDNLRELPEINESVVLSTCNRVEIYGETSLPTDLAVNRLRQYLDDQFEIDESSVRFYDHEDESAAFHLFEVASGLDSMVLGETEIFGQVKRAYEFAQRHGNTARRLNRLFQQSFSVGKLIRRTTSIQQGSTSIGAAAVDLAEKKIFGKLDGCRVMIIGAGEMSRITAQSLVSRGASSIIVSNRNFDRAKELAAELNGSAIRFDDWADSLKKVDIIVSSTSAPHPVIHRQHIEEAMRVRRGQPLFLIDIAVPRDIDTDGLEVENAYLYNIDELQEIADEGLAQRERQLEHCRALIDQFIVEKGIPALRDERPRLTDAPPRVDLPSSDRQHSPATTHS
ncbi:MAG: glutamyl-tRNA reductase [Verrucomicrobiota bacterium]